MQVLRSAYQYINILSLDVAGGAVIGCLFFARVFGIAISPYVLASLGLTVWIIYTIDHLRDAKTIPSAAATDRHRFHQEFFRGMLLVVLFASALDFVLLWFVPESVLVSGVVLGAVVSVYLALQRYLKFLKEFFVAMLYTAGVLLPSLSALSYRLQDLHYLLIGKFFVTALMNLLIFSLFDYEKDRDQHQHSFVTWFGTASTRLGVLLLGLLNILSGLVLWSFDPGVAPIFVFMNAMLLAILFLQKYLTRNNYYRILGDAVFFIPVFHLL